MKIAICDDTSYDLKNLEAVINEYSKVQNIPFELDSYNDPNILVNRISYFDSNEYSLLFLDICMHENGIKIAEKIRKYNTSCFIVFVTSSKDYAVDAFKVRAYDYILKPFDKNEIFSVLDKILETINNAPKTNFKLKTIDHNIVNVDIKNVAYIESSDRRMVFHLMDKSVLTTTSLRAKFIDSIPFEYEKFNFILSHTSYIVNMNAIKLINDYEFLLKNGDSVPVSKRLFTTVKDKYIKYLIGE